MAKDGNKVDGGNSSSTSTPTPDNRGWISIAQLATICEKDYRTVRKWVAEKRVIAVKVGGQFRIYKDEVDFILTYGTRPPQVPEQSTEQGAP